MTTAAENELLTRVGRGTPMGETMRRYWLPVGISADLQKKPTMVRLLGEDLVLFRDTTGRPGLLGAQCPHRRANLCLGSPGSEGLRCRYHGWYMNHTGKVLATPSEPPESTFKDTIQHTAYPIEELGGIVFTYMGPPPVPLLPRFDFIAGEGEHHVKITGISNSNWLQAVENGIDPLHVSFLHADVWSDLEVEPEIGFEQTDWGLVHKAYRPTAEKGVLNYREHHLLMPGISVGGSQQRNLEGNAGTPPTSCRWSVPIDDTHTLIIRMVYKPADNPGRFTRDPIPRGWKPIKIEPYREYKEHQGDGPVTLGYTMPGVIATEDATLIDSLGPVVDRENEHLLPMGDFGVVSLRKLYLDAVAAVQAGRDPLGVIRDESKNQVITIPAYEYPVTEAEMKDRQRQPAPA
jgi:5,5'-dehydrodivanillate O-demethylase oxygenase subunit